MVPSRWHDLHELSRCGCPNAGGPARVGELQVRSSVHVWLRYRGMHLMQRLEGGKGGKNFPEGTHWHANIASRTTHNPRLWARSRQRNKAALGEPGDDETRHETPPALICQ